MAGELKTRAITGVGGGLLTGLLRTARVEVSGREHYDAWWGAGKPVIFVLWHGRLLPSSFVHRGQGLATLISQHRDGDYIAGVVERWWGFHAIRGSSTRGGSAAFRQIVRTLKNGRAIAITPDGPRGPAQIMKTGPIIAAQLAGVPLIPVSAGASRAWWIRSWDRFLVPKPLSRIVLEFGEPFHVGRDAGPEVLEAARQALEGRLNELTRRVDAHAAR